MLLDLHPEPRLNPVTVRTSAGTTRAGVLGYSESFIETIAAADEALAVLEREEVFAREQQTEFEVLIHFDSAALWQTYLETQAQYYVPPDEAMLGSIDRALEGAPGEVVMTEWIRGTRFRRLG
ncbi:MAG: hypothetical protein IIA54_01280 [Chloroflexi bacterium]|nr:hypothetical protein [Chloroflexota bacterium]